jgi:hypothetical protein
LGGSLGFGDTLVGLLNKIEPPATAEIASQAPGGSPPPCRIRRESESYRISRLGVALAAFCLLLPSSPHTHLLALSNMLLQPVSEATEGEERPNDRKLLTDLCAQLDNQDLAKVLKYPFCTGQAEQIALAQLQAKTQRDFARDVWKFVEQADSAGVKDVDNLASRASVQDALKGSITRYRFGSAATIFRCQFANYSADFDPACVIIWAIFCAARAHAALMRPLLQTMCKNRGAS